MITIDDVTESVRHWLDAHLVLPDIMTPITGGEYADGTRVSVAFVPDAFLSGGPTIPSLIYRLSRAGYAASTVATPEFVRDVGFGVVHRGTARQLS